MMDHAAFRRTLLADPKARSPELDAHRDACADCRRFAERLASFESRLEGAMRISVDARSARRAQPRWFALAASVMVALVAAGVLWLSVPRTSLAADVVAHMTHEMPAWDTTQPVAPGLAEQTLRAAGAQLKPEAGAVSYASQCRFRGRVVPHLVVQSASGPVTVMVLVHEKVSHEVRFEEDGFRGRLLPVQGHGAIAVLEQPARTPALDVDSVAAQVRAAMVYDKP